MTDQELKKLRRGDLLELLIAQEKENQRLRSQVEQMEKQLADRAIALEQAGSIAEAALRLNGVFEAAQAAADQYLENIRRLGEGPEEKDREEQGEPASGPETAEAPISNKGPRRTKKSPASRAGKGNKI